MVRLIAQYQIKDEARDKVQKAIKKFISAVKRKEPETKYEAYNLSNSNEFLHIMAFPNESAQQNIKKLHILWNLLKLYIQTAWMSQSSHLLILLKRITNNFQSLSKSNHW